jgi:hypothetical protein
LTDGLPARVGRLGARVADRQDKAADRSGRVGLMFLLAHGRDYIGPACYSFCFAFLSRALSSVG